MSESVLKSILEESARLEWVKYENAQEHVFSKKHERKMKHVFKLFERNDCKLKPYIGSRPHYHFRFTKRNIIVLLAVIFLAALAGCGVTYFTSKNFYGKVNADNTELFVINTENCPATIEDKYYLPCLPDGYEVSGTDSTPFYEWISYENPATEQTLTFCQFAKASFDSTHYDTENQKFEGININGHSGLCLDYSSQGYNYAVIVWDNGDYIFELFGECSKNELYDLAKTAKVIENNK
jgi:hypothetical protein